MDGISDLTKREFMGEVKHILSHTKIAQPTTL